MISQFEKRKKKEAEAAAANEPKPADIPLIITPNQVAVEFTHIGYDIYLGPDNRTYYAIGFKYNPATGLVAVESIVPTTRQLGLIHANQKIALKTLIGAK